MTFMVQDKVRVYTDSGQLVREWGKRGKADGELHMPGGIVLEQGGTVYVADQANHRVQRFNTRGEVPGPLGRARLQAGAVRRQRHGRLALRRPAFPGE